MMFLAEAALSTFLFRKVRKELPFFFWHGNLDESCLFLFEFPRFEIQRLG